MKFTDRWFSAARSVRRDAAEHLPDARGERDIAVIEPNDVHYYQPLWTLVGGGLADVRTTIRREESVLPRHATWIRDNCVSVDPGARVVTTAQGRHVEYDRLVLAPGIQLDWDLTPGLTEALATPHVSSNYDVRLAPKTWEVMRVGLPVAAILAAEAWLFCIGALLMARFGADAVAAHQIAINFASLCFMVPTAIGMATTVRVGYAAGAGDAEGVALRGRVGVLLGLAFALMSATVMACAPHAIVSVYTDAAHLAGPAARFLAYAALFQVFDCVQATCNGALRGLKDTRAPMTITLLAYWGVGMPLALFLSFGTDTGPSGIWWGFIAGLMVAAAGLAARFLARTR